MKGQDHDGRYKEMLWESSLSHGEFLNHITLFFFSTDVAFLTVFSGCLSWLLALSASWAISSVLEATVTPSHAFLHFLCLSPDISKRCSLPAEGLWETHTQTRTHLCPIWTLARGGLRAGVQTPQLQPQPRDSPGPPSATVFKVFVNPKDLRVLLHCCRPGVPAVSCIHRLAGDSPRSPPIDCTWPHCQDGKWF